MCASRRRPFLVTSLLTALASGSVAMAAPASSASGCIGGSAGASAQLYGVAATSVTNAWAVGHTGNGIAHTLIEQWNGTGWCQVPSPSPGGTSQPSGLNSVAATSSTDAWAVGSFFTATGGDQTLIVHWDGTSWQRAASPDPSGARKFNILTGVAAVSAISAWAVGHYADSSGGQATMILHWNGTKWARVTSPNPTGYNNLSGVAAKVGITWAVGSGGPPVETLAVHRLGATWQQVPSPNPSARGPNSLSGVAVTSGSNAWAVGYYASGSTDQGLILRWNGGAWTQVTSPQPGSGPTFNILSKVAATSATNAWAVGYYGGLYQQTFIVRWHGSSWRQVTSPDPGGPFGQSIIEDVAATSASDAWAVGFYGNGSHGGTMILRWNGTAWTQVTSP